MSRNYLSKEAGFSERIQIAMLTKLPPFEVLQWMKENHKESEEGVYMDMRNEPEGRAILEYCLYRRNDPLIDFSIARYGYTSEVLKRVYKRCDSGTRLAALANPAGSLHLKNADFWSKASDLELKAFFSNRFLSGGLFTNLFTREHGFKDLTDETLLKLVSLCAGHPRLNREYSSTLLDGMDDYNYHRTFSVAWDLAKSVPVTTDWANALDGLLGRCRPPIGFQDAVDCINRWDLPEEFKQGDRWYQRGPFFQVRSTLAQLITPENLVNNDDAALRIGFYRDFDPTKFTDLQAYFSRDGEEFVYAAMYNQKFWKTEEFRNALSIFSWKCPDPSSMMDMPNSFRAAKSHFAKLHPEWFLEKPNEESSATEPGQILDSISALSAQVQNVEVSLKNYSSKLPSNVSWWIVAGLLALQLFVRS